MQPHLTQRTLPFLLGLLCFVVSATPSNANSLLLTARYLHKIHKKIEKKWDKRKLPVMELHKRSVTLTVWIGKKGTLLKSKIAQTSGLKSIDKSILKAAATASPFPKPPTALRKTLTTVGMDIVFRPRMFRKKLLKGGKRYYRNVTTAPRWRPRISPPKRR
jgi:TonB family protein